MKSIRLFCSVLTGSLLLTSCANIKPRRTTNQSASRMINSFKDSTQKRSLDNLIVNDGINKNIPFIKRQYSETTRYYIKKFSKRERRGFTKLANRAQKYRPIVEKIFQEHNLPKELFYVGLIESGYKMSARSHAGAVGPWQFIRETGIRYGLRVSRRNDERLNIYKSTKAAALFFQDLYNIFGSWELALAAYNAGEYGVIRRIKGANTRDFYVLSKKKVLPKETRHYVPKILAAMTILEAPRKYGITVKEYNHKNIARVLKKASTVKLSKKLVKKTPKLYKVKAGENLYQISMKFNIRMSTLARINRLKKNRIYAGQKLRLTGRISRISTRNKKVKHRVKRGENLTTIANRYKVSISKIKRLNRLRNSKIFPGQRLIIKHI